MRHPLVHKWPNDAEYRDRCPHAPTAARSRPARRPRSPTSWTGRRCPWSRRRRGRRTGGPRSPAPSALSKVTENGSSPAGRTTDPAHLPSTPDPGCCTSAGAERTHPTAVHIPSPQQIAGLASPWRIVRFMAMASSSPPSRQSHGPPQYFAGYPVRWVISPILHSTPSACSSEFAGTQGFEQTRYTPPSMSATCCPNVTSKPFPQRNRGDPRSLPVRCAFLAGEVGAHLVRSGSGLSVL